MLISGAVAGADELLIREFSQDFFESKLDQNDPNITRIEAYRAKGREYPDLIYYSLNGIVATPGSMLNWKEFKDFAKAEVPYKLTPELEAQVPEFAVAFHGHVPMLNMNFDNDGRFVVGLPNLSNVIAQDNVPTDMLNVIDNLNGTFEPASGPQKALGCAVVNTKELLFLTAKIYREWAKELWGDDVDKKFHMYLEDSQGAKSDNHFDKVYRLSFMGENTMLLTEINRTQGTPIITKRLVSCVDETQLMNESRRGASPHNSDRIVIGPVENPGIAAFLEPIDAQMDANGNVVMNGNPALHYLHTIDEKGEISQNTRSTERYFEHLAQVIAGNNNGVIEIVIDERLLPQYMALIDGIKNNDQKHPINRIKLVMVDPAGNVNRVFNKNLNDHTTA